MDNQLTAKNESKLVGKPGFKWLAILVILGITLLLNRSAFTSSNSIHYVNPKAEIDLDQLSGHTIEQHFYANEAIRSIYLTVYSEEGELKSRSLPNFTRLLRENWIAKALRSQNPSIKRQPLNLLSLTQSLLH